MKCVPVAASVKSKFTSCSSISGFADAWWLAIVVSVAVSFVDSVATSTDGTAAVVLKKDESLACFFFLPSSAAAEGRDERAVCCWDVKDTVSFFAKIAW